MCWESLSPSESRVPKSHGALVFRYSDWWLWWTPAWFFFRSSNNGIVTKEIHHRCLLISPRCLERLCIRFVAARTTPQLLHSLRDRPFYLTRSTPVHHKHLPPHPLLHRLLHRRDGFRRGSSFYFIAEVHISICFHFSFSTTKQKECFCFRSWQLIQPSLRFTKPVTIRSVGCSESSIYRIALDSNTAI